MTDELAPIAKTIDRDGFAFVRAPEMHALLETAGLCDWSPFADSWNDLGVDSYMADGGRYRRRRFAAFRASPSGITRKPHQPHYQSRDYNPLHGGIERWFDPVLPEIGTGPSMQTILQTCRGLFDQLTPGADWHIEVHQFRIEARVEEEGRPTPEGMHRDGVDHVLVLLVHRENIRSGVTTINDLEGHPLGSFTLAQPFDSALVDDRRVMHGVTPV